MEIKQLENSRTKMKTHWVSSIVDYIRDRKKPVSSKRHQRKLINVRNREEQTGGNKKMGA